MSLELVIQENTNAIRELIAAIGNGLRVTPEQVAAVTRDEAPKAKKSGAVRTADSPKDSTTADATSSVKDEPAAPAATEPTTAPSYQDAAAAVTTLSKIKGREAAVTALAQFGAAKLPEVKPGDYAALIAACQQAMEG